MTRLNNHSTEEDLLARSLIQQLDLATQDIGHDISERLRVARRLALSARPEPVRLLNYRTALQSHGSAQGPGEGLNLWRILASALPLIVLVLGLVLVQIVQQELVEDYLATVDSAILLDDLPPDAYTDPGFVQFLKIQLVQPNRHE